MFMFRKNCRVLHINGGYTIPVEMRRSALYRARPSRLRRLLFTLVAIVSLTLVLVHQVSDASTRYSYSASDYLTWLLRGDGFHTDSRDARPVPGAVLLSSLSKTPTGRGEPALRVDMGITRAVIEQVERGDTLFSVLQRHGVARRAATEVVRAGGAVARRHKVGNLTRPLQAGRLLKLTFDQTNRLTSLQYPLDNARALHVARKDDGAFAVEVRKSSLGVKTNETGEAGEAKAVSAAKEAGGVNEAGGTDAATEAKAVSAVRESREAPRVVPVSASALLPAVPAPLRTQDLFTGSARQIRDTVRSGDLLTTLLARHGINQATAYRVATAAKPVFNLARMMKAGHDVRIAVDQDGQMLGMTYAMNPETVLWIMRQGDGAQFKSHLQKKKFDTQLKQAAGSIGEDGSLFLAGKAVGLSHGMVARLANLFEWDIDFARDIHAGDQFRVVYEARYYQGRHERDGEIVAAEFVNQGRVLQVFRYVDPAGHAGYYDAKGQSIRKMFIRAPVDFTRITSGFTRHREHPIFGFTRAHKGVDYAAPQGTPVRAAGDGRITFVGHKGEYGQLVSIRHNDKYSTAYAHLSSFGRGLQVGSRVKQGDVIGRVGATGTATGPHLHYEVLVNEQQVNPLSIQQVTANPVLARHADDFRLQTGRSLAMLHNTRDAKVAGLLKPAAVAD
ncbi:MAG: peptidoglycan DD-metalloendopeptidase family protein [Magnetococcus sp. DMHC-8]